MPLGAHRNVGCRVASRSQAGLFQAGFPVSEDSVPELEAFLSFRIGLITESGVVRRPRWQTVEGGSESVFSLGEFGVQRCRCEGMLFIPIVWHIEESSVFVEFVSAIVGESNPTELRLFRGGFLVIVDGDMMAGVAREAFELGEETSTIKGRPLWQWGLGGVDQGGEEIAEVDQIMADRSGLNRAFPDRKHWHMTTRVNWEGLPAGDQTITHP